MEADKLSKKGVCVCVKEISNYLSHTGPRPGISCLV